jgi:hypothetical protein
MKKYLLALCLLALPSLAFAQHPCDTVAPVNPSVLNPYRVQFCHDLKDLDGTAILPADAQVRLTINGTAQALRPLPAPLGAASPTGFSQYEIAGLTSVKGAHSIIVGLVTSDGEGISAPFAYTVRGKAPKPPSARVVQ